jgi:hypothetical protein
MPYSAGPNIAARPNLVFEYDLGDVQNSYKGEPTTNLVNPSWTAWSVDGSGQGNIGTRTIISPYYCQIVDNNANTRQSIYVEGISASTTYTFSVQYRSIAGAPTLRFQIQAYNGGSYISTMSFATTAQLGIVNNSEWQTAYITLTTPANTNRILWFMQDGDDYTTYTHAFELKNPQVEQKSHPTPFVVGTRSNTQGLLDISGYNRTIDLANMSFNSSAQMTFDGTDDYIPSIGTAVIPAGSVPYTVSVWVNRGRNNVGYEELLAQWTYANSSNSFFFGFNNSNVRFSDSWNDVSVSGAGNTNVWMNLVGVNTGANAYIYLNGALAATKGSALTYTGTGPFIMGRQGELAGEYFLGRMNNVQIYNSALSAQEVLRNYNQLKGRFNLI